MKIITLQEARQQGINTYYTGNPCVHGHTTYRYVVDRRCSECAKIKQQNYIANNKDKIKLRNVKNWANKTETELVTIYTNRKEYYYKTQDIRLAEKKRSYDNLKLNAEWLQGRRDKTNAYRAIHGRKPEKYNPLSRKKWKLENRGAVNASWTKRHVAKLNRTPKWTTKEDLETIKHIYIVANQFSKSFGTEYHVDHIIPLQGKLVSGLHVPSNLQIIPAMDNIKKGNKYEVVT
jgi:hypothetical protein